MNIESQTLAAILGRSFVSNDGVSFVRQNTINFRFSLVLAARPE